MVKVKLGSLLMTPAATGDDLRLASERLEGWALRVVVGIRTQGVIVIWLALRAF